VLAAASPPDRHGYFSLGTNAEYIAALIGRVPFFVEVNHRMPRTQGLNQLHASQLVGWCERDEPLVDVAPAQPDERDRAIARHIVERIPDGATLQVGIGGIPNALLSSLGEHRDLGIHTELLSDGIVDLVEQGVVTGTRKSLRPNKVSACERRLNPARASCRAGRQRRAQPLERAPAERPQRADRRAQRGVGAVHEQHQHRAVDGQVADQFGGAEEPQRRVERDPRNQYAGL
jgi:hypothetical protein